MQSQGDGCVLKTVFVVLLALAFLSTGALNILKQIKITGAADEIIRFINLVRTEVHYTTADYENIFLKGKQQNYKYISFCNNEIYLDKSVGSGLASDFCGFIGKIGTTDYSGQLNICDEYKFRFEEALKKRRENENKKIQVNTALSLFGALSVLIFFL